MVTSLGTRASSRVDTGTRKASVSDTAVHQDRQYLHQI